MPKDSFCIQYTNCTGCPNVNENILVYRNLPKGAHIPKDKCTQNCMLFMIKGELLINSEEYPVLPELSRGESFEISEPLLKSVIG